MAEGKRYELTIREMDCASRVVVLSDDEKTEYSFGRAGEADIEFNSTLMSRRHGFFIFKDGEWRVYEFKTVTNQLLLNGEPLSLDAGDMRCGVLKSADILRLDYARGAHREGVQIIFDIQLGDEMEWVVPLNGKKRITIGRDPSCDICVQHVSASRFHAVIELSARGYDLRDAGSTNGTSINGQPLLGVHTLSERDVIQVVNTTCLFSSGNLYIKTHAAGISLEAVSVTKTVGSKRRDKTILKNVSLCVEPGELVAVIGGSGAGKSTFLNCLSGFDSVSSGYVAINGQNIRSCFSACKSSIGFVPQQDIVYDELPLERMLYYSARQRMPADMSANERENRINEVLSALELTKHSHTLIKKLSGGQRKRASIAVELLADPSLFFLDEPASGLDPGTERALMLTLKELSRRGKTVVLVTHSSLCLDLCDKIALLGPGGRLCYFGSPANMLAYFSADDITGVYERASGETEFWAEKWENARRGDIKPAPAIPISGRCGKTLFFRQFLLITKRYAEITLRNKNRLLALALQAPLIGAIVALVSNGDLFERYSATQSILFTIVIASIWMGLLNAVGEICKERVILKRDLMANLRPFAYLLSKIIVLGACYAVQSVMFSLTFCLISRFPAESLILAPFPEMCLSVFITMITAGCLGLAVSALARSQDTAGTLVPYLLVPQLVFSGVLFDLSGTLLYTSRKLVVAYWGICSLCASCGVSVLPMTEMATPVGAFTPPTPVLDEYAHSVYALGVAWGAQAFIGVLTLLLCLAGIRRIRKRF